MKLIKYHLLSVKAQTVNTLRIKGNDTGSSDILPGENNRGTPWNITLKKRRRYVMYTAAAGHDIEYKDYLKGLCFLWRRSSRRSYPVQTRLLLTYELNILVTYTHFNFTLPLPWTDICFLLTFVRWAAPTRGWPHRYICNLRTIVMYS